MAWRNRIVDHGTAKVKDLAERANHLNWRVHPDAQRQNLQHVLGENGLLIHQQIIWVKARSVLTRSHFMWQHEPCFYGWVKGKQPKLKPPVSGDATTVWPIDQKGETDHLHQTQKPVELFARPICWHVRPGQVCYEPFSGSGTQMVAAEQMGRICFAMEKAPAFVAAALERMAKLGLEPSLQ